MSTTTPPIHVILDAIRDCYEDGVTTRLTPQEAKLVGEHAEFGLATLLHLQRGLPVQDLASLGIALGLLDPTSSMS